MAQIFYTDIPKLFECDISLSNAPLTDAITRVIFQVGGKKFMFSGTVDGLGHCTFTIPPLGSYNIIGSGTMSLEIIVETEIFEPFSDSISIVQSNGSDFNSFTAETNYDSVNNIDGNYTWLNKKVYDEAPYMVLPGKKFNIKLGDNKPDLCFFVYKLGEQFGDPIPLPNIAQYTITLKVYDFNYRLVCMGNVVNWNQRTGQITYGFHHLDFSESGIYYFEVEFSCRDKSFTLPTNNVKYEIIVRN